MKSIKYQKQLFNRLNTECKYIVFTIFLTAFSTFIFVPYVPIFLHNKFGFNASQVGLIVFLQFFIQQSGSFVSGFLSDKYGHYFLFKTGIYIRILSLLGIIFAREYVALMVFCLLVFSIGGAVLNLSQRSLLGSKAERARDKAFAVSLNNSFMNMGQATGILFGGIIYSISYSFSLVVATLIYFIILAIIAFKVTKEPKSISSSYNPLLSTSNGEGLLSNKFFLLVICSQFFYIAIWSKLTTYMSLFVANVYQSVVAYSVIMCTSLFIMSISQIALGTFIVKKNFKNVACFGYLMVALCFIPIFIWHNILILAVCMVLISVGVSVISLQNELQIINSKNIGSVYGVFRLFTGFGVLAVYVAGYIYQWLDNHNIVEYFWLYMSLFSLLVLLIIMVLYPKVKQDEKRFKKQLS